MSDFSCFVAAIQKRSRVGAQGKHAGHRKLIRIRSGEMSEAHRPAGQAQEVAAAVVRKVLGPIAGPTATESARQTDDERIRERGRRKKREHTERRAAAVSDRQGSRGLVVDAQSEPRRFSVAAEFRGHDLRRHQVLHSGRGERFGGVQRDVSDIDDAQRRHQQNRVQRSVASSSGNERLQHGVERRGVADEFSRSGR